jgi:hypothetical protein
MSSECLIKSTRKQRVSGSNGPRRHELKAFETVDASVPTEVIEEILAIANTYTSNDLGGDNYQISQHCDVKTAFTASEAYRQILLQECVSPDANVIDEENYTNWRTDLAVSNIRSYLETTFKHPVRTRISIMPPGHDLNWHIDTDTSVLCRVQVAAQSSGSEFQFRTKQGHSSLTMIPGNSYFVNTGWTHRVVNTTNDVRIVLIFGVLFNNIPNNKLLMI